MCRYKWRISRNNTAWTRRYFKPGCFRFLYHTSSIYPALPSQYRLKSYHFFAFSPHYHGNHFAKFLAHVLNWVKTYHHAEFQRNPPTGLAGMMVQTYRQTDRPTDRPTGRQIDRQTDKLCFFPDMPPGIKPSQGGSPPPLKVWSKSNRGILRNGRT